MTDSARIPVTDHLARPWRIHALASDFELLDVWRFGVRGKADQFGLFARTMSDMGRTIAQTNGLTRALFGLRRWLGKLFGWDRERPRFQPVYQDDREALLEIANGTVHALMHFGWVALEGGEFAPQMAVYVKHRTWFGRFYMGLISPFRHLVVYPSLLRAVERRWSAEANAPGRSHGAMRQAILHDG